MQSAQSDSETAVGDSIVDPDKPSKGEVTTRERCESSERKEECDQDHEGEIIEENQAQYEETVKKEREERKRKAKERKRERDRINQAERREYRKKYGIDMINEKKEGPRTRSAVYSKRYREKKKEMRELMKYLEE